MSRRRKKHRRPVDEDGSLEDRRHPDDESQEDERTDDELAFDKMLDSGETAELHAVRLVEGDGVTFHQSSTDLRDRIAEVIPFYGIFLTRETAIKVAIHFASVRMMKHAVLMPRHAVDFDYSSFKQAIRFFTHELPKRDLWGPDIFPDPQNHIPYANHREH